MIFSEIQGFTSLIPSQRLSKIVSVGVTAETALGRARDLYGKWQQRNAYEIRVASRDPSYAELQKWLLSQMPEQDQRVLEVTTIRKFVSENEDDDDDGMPAVGGQKVETKVIYAYTGRETIRLKVGGHKVDFSVKRGEPIKDRYSNDFIRTDDCISITTWSKAGRQAVKDLIEGFMVKAPKPYEPKIITATSYGWERAHNMPARDPSTVVLADGKMERLQDDITQFLGAEKLYAKISQPWHRGYLLYGPGGTGKTSAALALAYANKLDVYCLPLTDIKSDTGLMELLGSVGKRCVLLIEDVDIAKASKGRKRKKKAADTVEDEGEGSGVTLNGLLNSLDGALTPHGLIMIMTTNHPEELDPALKRKGRCDLSEEIGYLDDDQVSRLVTSMTGTAGPLPSIGDRLIVPADIAELVKQNIKDMGEARQAIVDFLNNDEEESCETLVA